MNPEFDPKKKYDDLDSRILTLENQRYAPNVHSKIQSLFETLEELVGKISVIKNKIEIINLDEKYVELFTEKDLKNYYQQCGLSLNEVKTFVDKYIHKGEPTSLSTVSRYVNGETTDLIIRSNIGKFLRQAAILKNKECDACKTSS